MCDDKVLGGRHGRDKPDEKILELAAGFIEVAGVNEAGVES
jgi:hypothetical protein